jgi:hypothetical protein
MISKLKLDFDNCKELSYKRVFRILKVLELLRLEKYLIAWIPSKTKKGMHLEIWLKKKLKDWQIGYIQALMNSDYKRECFNLLRIASNSFKNQSWNVLFKKKFKLKLDYERKTEETIKNIEKVVASNTLDTIRLLPSNLPFKLSKLSKIKTHKISR